MVSVNVNNFADVVPFIHPGNVENIEAEGLHEWDFLNIPMAIHL